MRYVKVPAPIQATSPDTGKPRKKVMTDDLGQPVISGGRAQLEDIPAQGLYEWLRDNVLNNTKMGKGIEAIRRYDRIEKVFEEKNLLVVDGVKYAEVEEADFKVLKSIIDEVEFADLRVARQFRPFVEAFEPENAKEQKPEAKKVEKLDGATQALPPPPSA